MGREAGRGVSILIASGRPGRFREGEKPSALSLNEAGTGRAIVIMKKRTRHPTPTKLYPRTPRQREILLFIRDYMAGAGYSPTYEEMAHRFGVSKVTIFEHIHNMEDAGLLTLERHQSRSIVLSDRLYLGNGSSSCPTCGRAFKDETMGENGVNHAGTEQAVK